MRKQNGLNCSLVHLLFFATWHFESISSTYSSFQCYKGCLFDLYNQDHFSQIVVSLSKLILQKLSYKSDISKENKTEKSFSPIGCPINDHGLYGLFCSKSETRRKDNNGGGRKTWAYEAAQLTRSLKDMLNNNPFPCTCKHICIHK